MMMETLDSGIGSRSPTPDSNSSHSQTHSSKVAKVTTNTNHINNNSHNTSSSNAGTYNSTKTKGSLEKGDASLTTSSASLSSVSTVSSAASSGNGGSNASGNESGSNHTSGTSNGGHNNNASSNNKTYRDYNNRHSSGHGPYKKYGNHQNHHYGGYGSHNMHYQRYNNGNGHRNYGNKHYHNSSNYHNNHNHYQGQNYNHQYGHQHHHHHNNTNNNTSGSNNNSSSSSSSTNGSSHSNSHNPQHQSSHNSHHTTQNQHSQYSNAHSNGSIPNHHSYNPHHQNQHNNNSHQPHLRNAPPQVYISSEAGDPYAWASRRGGGETTTANNTEWSSSNLVNATTGDSTSSSSSAVQISLNLSALKQGYYSPSPQNTSPATSPSTTDSSDAYSLSQEETISTTSGTGAATTNGVTSGVRLSSNSSSCIDTTVHYTTATNGGAILDSTSSSLSGSTLGPTTPSGNVSSTAYSYTPFHPHAGFYTYPGAGHHHHLGGGAGGRTLPHHYHHHHHHHQLMSQNMGLLMPADSSYSLGNADSSISSSSSEKTLEWSDDGTLLTSCISSNDRGDDYGGSIISGTHTDNRCSTPEYIYTPFSLATSAPFTTANKKRFYNGTGTATGKLSQAVQNQRYYNYPRKMAYHLPGFPREWFDDLDPDEYVRAFSKFGEVIERPTALSQNPQCDSLSEGIWLKFVANQQTTETFRKKMELWRDVSRIVRTLNYNSHFKHDPRNFPTFGLQVVGSTMSGFGSNTSDVDMCLLVRGSDVDQRYEAVDKLQVLYGALSGTQWLDNVELIYAKVPILKFRDPKRSLEVDLNCNNFVGIRNTHLLYCYSQADWRLKPLVLVVKLWAHYHGINDAKNMTISSYSLVLMVVHFLQCGVGEPVLPILQQSYPDKFSNTTNILHVKINEILPPWTTKNTETIGNLLIRFLEYYAKDFDYSEDAVSVRIGRTISIKNAASYKSTKNDPHQWKFLCIEEPFDRTNTARSVYDKGTFDKIIRIFQVSHERLQASRNLESIFTPISESDARAISVVIR